MVARSLPSLPLDFPRPPPAERPRALSVGDLGRTIKRSLDGSFEGQVWVEGEVTGARPVSSGHLYFRLKDEREDACIDVAIYRTNVTPRVRALIADGARVRLRGRPTFWPPGGRLQLVADRAETGGKGALLVALEGSRARLALEGLFAAERKRPLPAEPRRVGVVTSRSGAVIHDICRVAFKRGPVRLLLAPAVVQGNGAAESIVRALGAIARVPEVDVIILGRGGGLSDDLSAFNDEAVVRAVAASAVPVVSAVGHETDVTLADFAADVRAATPSHAAELVVPNAAARREDLGHIAARLARAAHARVKERSYALVKAERRLGDVRLRVSGQKERLAHQKRRLATAARELMKERRERRGALETRLGRLHPNMALARERTALQERRERMAAALRATLTARARALSDHAGRLDAMSPLKVLGRGYAIATTADGRAVRDAEDVQPGDSISVRVARARLDARVLDVRRAADVEEPEGEEAEP